VRLRFAKSPGVLRYEVSQATRQEAGPVIFKRRRTLYVTQVIEDSLDARLIHVRIDSGRGSEKMPMSLGPFPGFRGWFNDQRDRLDTIATDLGVEGYRADVFDGTMPLPTDSITQGGTWTVDPRRHAMFHVQDAPVHAVARGVVKRISILNNDTIAVLGFTFDVKGKFTQKDGREIDVHGNEEGEETFSVNQGITLRLHVAGKIEWDTDVMGARLEHVYTIVHGETDRTLIP